MAIHPAIRAGALVAVLGGLAGCAIPAPAPPPLVVFPGGSKTFADFQRDDASCRGIPLAGTPAATPRQPAGERVRALNRA